MGVEIGNVHFTVRHGDIIRIGSYIDLVIHKVRGRSQLRITVQAPKAMSVRHARSTKAKAPKETSKDG